jgi:peptidoglycan/LPS O-acetylase OafA/YrhL
MGRAMKLQGGRMEFLDALRGVAAGAVVLQHTLESVSPQFRAWSREAFNFGQFGVVVFFLISGFIIPVTLERTRSVGRFWVNRACRLFPVYWVSLALVLVIYFAGRPEVLPPEFARHWLRSTAANLAMAQLFAGAPNAIPSYWTLGMELVFYLVVCLLFAARLLSRPVACAWLGSLAMLALVLAAGLGLHRSLPAGRLGLLVTALFGAAVFGMSEERVKLGDLLKLAPVVAFALAVGFWFRFHAYPRADSEALSFPSAILTWAVAYAVFFAAYALRGFEFPRWLLWLGQISYSLYLMQGLVLSSFPALANPWLVVAVNLVGSVGLAALVNRLVEQPANAYLKAQTRKLFSRPHTHSPQARPG